MPLDENAKAVNVVGSVQQYFNDSLANILNSSLPAIDYGGGMSFKDDDLLSWVQVRMLAPARPAELQGPFAGRGGSDFDARGQELHWVLNVNCFVRPLKAPVATFSNLAIWQLRDQVLNAFTVGTRIAVKDYADALTTGNETIGYLFISEIMEDRAIYDPERTELLQHNLVFLLRWTETWVS